MKNLLNKYAFEPHTEQKKNSIKNKSGILHIKHCKGQHHEKHQGLPCDTRGWIIHLTWEKATETRAWDNHAPMRIWAQQWIHTES